MYRIIVMTDILPDMKKIKSDNIAGIAIFLSGLILFVSGVIYSIVMRIGFTSPHDDISYTITMIGVGIPLIFLGVNMILNPVRISKINLGLTILERSYIYDFVDYIENNKMLFFGGVLSIISIIYFLVIYPRYWYFPQTYVIYILYMTGIYLLFIHTFSNTANIKEKLENSNRIIKEKEDMCKEENIPHYIIEFTDNLKKDIDDATKILSERAISSIGKYKSDNEQLHIDTQKYRRRIEKEKDEYKKYANERVIKNLMNMLHNIDYILKYKDIKDIPSLIDDIKGIKENLYKIITEEDVEIINPTIGENFDDTKCCAVQVLETDKFSDNRIVQVKKLGYRFKSGKIICADVVVSKKSMQQIVREAQKIEIDNNKEIER